MTAYVNYPLCASDDDEVFDAPAGSKLIGPAGTVVWVKADDDFTWNALGGGKPQQTGAIWNALFDGPQFDGGKFAEGWVLRVPLWFAEPRDMTEGGYAVAEARAEARVAAMFASK